MTDFLSAALDYGRKGWPVFPVNPADKKALIKNWQNDASIDASKITEWWTRWPKAMIGALQGANGCFAVDLDILNKETGEVFDPEELKAALEEEAGALPATRIAITGSGGWHLYFKNPEGQSVPRKIRRLAQTDICGAKGYTIVPPSARADGATYRWLTDCEIATAPQALVDFIVAGKNEGGANTGDITGASGTGGSPVVSHHADPCIAENRRKYAYAALARQTQAVASCHQGGRNAALNNAALALGHIVGAGLLAEGTVRAELFAAAAACGLVKDDGAKSVNDTITSGLRKGIETPLDVTDIGTRVAPSRNVRGASAPRPPPSSDPPPSPPSPAPLNDVSDSRASHEGATGEEPPSQGGGGLNSRSLWRLRKAAGCSAFPLTDLGNAQRFVARFGRNFFFVQQWGWLAWDGKRWNAKDADAILSRAVHSTIKAIAGEARALRILSAACDPDIKERSSVAGESEKTRGFFDPVVDIKKGGVIVLKSDRISGWCVTSQSNAHVSCVSNLAKAYLTATPDQFDVDAMAFNVSNGTLRFKKTSDSAPYVSFGRHQRADMLTKLSDVVFDRDAGAPIYDSFLARVQPDPDMCRHLHAWGGVSLTGLPLAYLSLWYGTGRNGKSTCIDAWGHVMGEYGQTIPIESFLDQGRLRKGGEASPDIAGLPGVRGLRTSEPERGSKLAEGLVKMLTGGEPMKARHLNRDFFEFRPIFKLTMQSNHLLRIDGTDEGIWARMLLVPWAVMIPKEERDTSLPEKLKAEASGILNRLLDGLCDFLDNGLSPTAAVTSATAEYRDDSDPIGRFLAECTTIKDVPAEAGVEGGPFYKLYVAWAKANGEAKFSPKSFSRALQDHGIRRKKSSGIYYMGIRETKEIADFAGKEFEDAPKKT